MKKLSTAIIFTLMALFATSIPTLASASQSYTCTTASKVMSDYKGNPQAWTNRHLYAQSRQATLYFNANCSASTARSASISPATCKDCYNAGYRKGLEAGKFAAEATMSSSVTTPPPYRKANIQTAAPAPARTVYVSHKPKTSMIQHGDHSHHSEEERLDCELTDTLNRQAGPVTSFVKRTVTPASFSKVRTTSKVAMIQHGDHSHHTEVEKADCALTDALNRRSGPVTSFVKRGVTPANFSKVRTTSKVAMIKHGDHSHHTEVEKADCALTDALNRRGGSVVTAMTRSH